MLWFRRSKCEQGTESALYSNRQGFAARRMDDCSPTMGHIRLQKRVQDELLKVIVPAHRPVKRSTLAHILKQARIELDQFLQLL